MKQPRVGPVTALAFVHTIGPVKRFPSSKKLVSYLGLNPSGDSSGGRQRLGAISKQGNSMMRHFCWAKPPQAAARFDPELRRYYLRIKFRRGISGVAKVAIARTLAVRLYWRQREAAQPNTTASMQGSSTCPMVDASPSRYTWAGWGFMGKPASVSSARIQPRL